MFGTGCPPRTGETWTDRIQSGMRKRQDAEVKGTEGRGKMHSEQVRKKKCEDEGGQM
jgi:hypothetical protein